MSVLPALATAVMALGCVAAGCATSRPPAAAAPAPAGLQERAAALFDAAAHGDELRLKTLVDWSRFRTIDGVLHSDSDDAAAALLSRIEAEPAPSARFVDVAARDLHARLAAVAEGPMPPRPVAGVMNARLAALEHGAPDGAPPSLARLHALAADSLDGARELTYEGARRVTLVFVADMLVGVLDAR